MPPEIILALAVYVILTAFICFFLWPFRGASPIFWYPIALALIGVGVLLQIDFSHPSDETHVFATFVATTSFATPAVLSAKFFRLGDKLARFRNAPVIEDTVGAKIMVWLLFIVSIALSTLYFVQVGTNMVVMAITSGIQDDYSTIRLAMYSGEVYTGAGYFNQFKNFILPLTSALISMYIWKRSRTVAYLVAPVIAIICVLAVAGAGQRTYLVYSFCATVFGFILYNQGQRKVLSFKLIISSVILFAGFSMMTALYKETSGSFLEPIRLSFERIFYTQQRGGLVAFQFLYDRPIVWFEEWGQSILGLLPGHRGSILANEIHNFMYSSFRGTAPPTLIGSAYYNGGMALVAGTFFFLGVLYSALYGIFLSGSRSAARCFGYGAMFFYLTTFFVGTIKYPFDNGIAAFLVFLILIRVFWRSPKKSHQELVI